MTGTLRYQRKSRIRSSSFVKIEAVKVVSYWELMMEARNMVSRVEEQVGEAGAPDVGPLTTPSDRLQIRRSHWGQRLRGIPSHRMIVRATVEDSMMAQSSCDGRIC